MRHRKFWLAVGFFLVMATVLVWADVDVYRWGGYRAVYFQPQWVEIDSQLVVKDTTFCDFYWPDDSTWARFKGKCDTALYAYAGGGAGSTDSIYVWFSDKDSATGWVGLGDTVKFDTMPTYCDTATYAQSSDSTWEAIFVGDTANGDHDAYIYAGDDGNWQAHHIRWDDGLDRWFSSGDAYFPDIYGGNFKDPNTNSYVGFGANGIVLIQGSSTYDIRVTVVDAGMFEVGQAGVAGNYIEINTNGIMRWGVGTADTCLIDECLIDFSTKANSKGVIKGDTLYGHCIDALDGARVYDQIPLIQGELHFKEGTNITLGQTGDTITIDAGGGGNTDSIYFLHTDHCTSDGWYGGGDTVLVDTTVNFADTAAFSDTAKFAWNSDSLDGLASGKFLRSDAQDTATGAIYLENHLVLDNAKYLQWEDSPGGVVRNIMGLDANNDILFGATLGGALNEMGIGPYFDFCEPDRLVTIHGNLASADLQLRRIDNTPTNDDTLASIYGSWGNTSANTQIFSKIQTVASDAAGADRKGKIVWVTLDEDDDGLAPRATLDWDGNYYLSGGGKYQGTDGSEADTFELYDDGDSTRLESDNPIKIGAGSVVIPTGGGMVVPSGDVALPDNVIGWAELETAVQDSIGADRTDSSDVAGWNFANKFAEVGGDTIYGDIFFVKEGTNVTLSVTGDTMTITAATGAGYEPGSGIDPTELSEDTVEVMVDGSDGSLDFDNDSLKVKQGGLGSGHMGSTVWAVIGDTADVLRGEWPAEIGDSADVVRADVSDTADALRAEWPPEISDTADVLRGEWPSEIGDSCDVVRADVSDTADALRAEWPPEISDTADVLRGEWPSEIGDTADVIRADVSDTADALRAEWPPEISDTADVLRGEWPDSADVYGWNFVNKACEVGGDTIYGPILCFKEGSNVTLTIDNDTMEIASTGGAAGDSSWTLAEIRQIAPFTGDDTIAIGTGDTLTVYGTAEFYDNKTYIHQNTSAACTLLQIKADSAPGHPDEAVRGLVINGTAWYDGTQKMLSCTDRDGNNVFHVTGWTAQFDCPVYFTDHLYGNDDASNISWRGEKLRLDYDEDDDSSFVTFHDGRVSLIVASVDSACSLAVGSGGFAVGGNLLLMADQIDDAEAYIVTDNTATGINLHDFLSGSPTTNYIPKWNGSNWAWAEDATGGAGAIGDSCDQVRSEIRDTVGVFWGDSAAVVRAEISDTADAVRAEWPPDISDTADVVRGEISDTADVLRDEWPPEISDTIDVARGEMIDSATVVWVDSAVVALRKDGSVALTADWAAGDFDITGLERLQTDSCIVDEFVCATSAEMPNAAAPVLNLEGQFAFDETDDVFLIYDGGTAQVYGHYVHQFSFNIADDGDWDDEAVPVFQVPKDMAITLIQVDATTWGTTPSLTYNIEERAWASGASPGTDIYSADQAADADGEQEISFSNPGIAAEAYLIFTTGTGAESGTVDQILVTVYYSKNRE